MIELSGTRRTFRRFQQVESIVNEWSRDCLREMELQASDPEAATELAALAEKREAEDYGARANAAYDAFVRSARRDMAVEKRGGFRLRP